MEWNQRNEILQATEQLASALDIALYRAEQQT